MSSYNLTDYETVKERKARFYHDHPGGRIIVTLLNPDSVSDYALFCAYVYLTTTDHKENLPRASGYALEIRDKTLQIGKSGKQYESVNFTSWVENCEESAVGRALDNAGYSGNKKCSRDEMEKKECMLHTLRQMETAQTKNQDIPHDDLQKYYEDTPTPEEEFESVTAPQEIKQIMQTTGPLGVGTPTCSQDWKTKAPHKPTVMKISQYVEEKYGTEPPWYCPVCKRKVGRP